MSVALGVSKSNGAELKRFPGHSAVETPKALPTLQQVKHENAVLKGEKFGIVEAPVARSATNQNFFGSSPQQLALGYLKTLPGFSSFLLFLTTHPQEKVSRTQPLKVPALQCSLVHPNPTPEDVVNVLSSLHQCRGILGLGQSRKGGPQPTSWWGRDHLHCHLFSPSGNSFDFGLHFPVRKRYSGRLLPVLGGGSPTPLGFLFYSAPHPFLPDKPSLAIDFKGKWRAHFRHRTPPVFLAS